MVIGNANEGDWGLWDIWVLDQVRTTGPGASEEKGGFRDGFKFSVCGGLLHGTKWLERDEGMRG